MNDNDDIYLCPHCGSQMEVWGDDAHCQWAEEGETYCNNNEAYPDEDR